MLQESDFFVELGNKFNRPVQFPNKFNGVKMKKSVFGKINSMLSILAGLAALAAFSCSSSNLSISDSGPVALISVVGNASAPWIDPELTDDENEDVNGLLSTAVNKLLDGSNPEILTAESRLDYAEETFRLHLAEFAGVEVLGREDVVESDAYKKLKKSYFNALVATKNADGYKDLTTFGAKNARILMREIGAKSLVRLEFEFRKEISRGDKWNGEVRAVVNMSANLMNERGKTVLNRQYSVRSSETVHIDSLKYDRDAFVELFPEIIDESIDKFIVDCMN